MAYPNEYQTVLDFLIQGATVVTPHDRLARTLKQDLQYYLKKPVIQSPACFSWENFLTRLFQQTRLYHSSSTFPILLSAAQQQQLWLHLLNQQENPVYQGLIQSIDENWRQCQIEALDFQHDLFDTTEQSRFFKDVCSKFTQKLTELQAITPEQLVPLLVQNPLPAPKCMIWFCFHELSAHQQLLQDYLAKQGTIHHMIDLSAERPHAYLYEASDEQDEMVQIVDWLTQQLAQGKSRIGVIVPNVLQKKNRLNRLLRQALPNHCYQFALGESLSTMPLVAHAMVWLGLDGKMLSYQEAELLLNSPFLAASQSERSARADFLNQSPLFKERHMVFQDFIQQAAVSLPQLTTILQDLVRYPQAAYVLEWAQYFRKRLAQLGFPGEYGLDSACYQTYQRFLLLFEEFMQLNAISSQMTAYEALSSLQTLANNTLFKPQAPATPIQILSLTEAVGLPFEALWISGMNADCLPYKVSFSPFIPLSLQKSADLPYTDPAQELLRAEKILNRLLAMNPDSVISYALSEEDIQQTLCPIVLDLCLLETFVPPLLYLSSEKNDLESWIDPYQLPPASDQVGSTRLLTYQAQCPFRAFAAYRLHATAHVQPADGLDALERGLILHRALESMWRNLKHYHQLCALSPQERESIIRKSIQFALKPYQKKRDSFPPIMQQIEMNRLTQLLNTLVTWEKTRLPFSVAGVEKRYQLTLAGMNFNIRVDRIDQLEDGSHCVIDYKSRLPMPLPWYEERPLEPQMLLYALLEDTIGTLLFVQLKQGVLTIKGLCDVQHNRVNDKTVDAVSDWSMLKKQWAERLRGLVEEFQNGYCLPKPIHPSTCQRCEFQNICRLPFKY